MVNSENKNTQHVDGPDENDLISTFPKFNSIIIVTYGRSGSTLLQGILNSLPSVMVRGENHDFCWGLYMAWKSLSIASTKFGGPRSNSSTAAWYGAKDLNPELFIEHAQEALKAQIIPKDYPRNICFGFKEIRYFDHLDELPNFLNFLTKLLPNTAIIFNTRDHNSVCNSAFWTKVPENDLRKKLAIADQIFFEYAQQNDNAFICRYERMVLGLRGLRPLFDFIGVQPDANDLNKIIQTPHSYVPKKETLERAHQDREKALLISTHILDHDHPCYSEMDYEEYEPCGKVVVFCIVKDEMLRLPWFLKYYRGLGCLDFIFIDTGSTDGTIEYLQKQSDVYLYHAPAEQLKTSKWGSAWVNILGLKHAMHRWVLLADIDECLTWPEQDEEGIPGLVLRAERLGLNRIFTPMIDIYPAEPCDTLSEYRSGEAYDKHCILMDSVEHTKAFWYKAQLILHSGPRLRYAPTEQRPPIMTKQNLYFVEYGGFSHVGSHFDTYRLPSPLVVPLLHFKFLPDFEQRARKAIFERHHWNNAKDYENYISERLSSRKLAFEGSVDFRSDEGVKKYIDTMGQIIRQAGVCGSVHWKKVIVRDGDNAGSSVQTDEEARQ